MLAVLLLTAIVLLETVEHLAYADGARHPERKWPRWIVGWIAHVGGILIWLPTLKVLPMSTALPLTAVCYATTALAARWVLKERVTLHRWTAIVTIMAGAALIYLGGMAE